MSSLIVVCPQCLTWVEPHSERCTECGVAVDVDAPDPDAQMLAQRVGEALLELGPIRLDRSGWPQLGHLVATTEGLLFLPDFLPRPNGAIEPRVDESQPSVSWLTDLSRAWWSRLRSPTPSADPVAVETSIPTIANTLEAAVPAFQRLFESPGGMFVARSSMRRLLARWNHLKIERSPSRSVTLRPVSGGMSLGDLERQLRERML